MVKKRKNRKLTLLVDVTFEKCEKWSEEECRLALEETMLPAWKELVEQEVFCIPQEYPIMFRDGCVGKFRLVYH